jgi:formate/nitrite transporter FocA (FNT family)
VVGDVDAEVVHRQRSYRAAEPVLSVRGAGTVTGVSDELSEAFRRTVEEGEQRLNRSWPELLATGTVGGLDISLGVLALLLVYRETHSEVLSALAFTIGFIALTLAHSELFTENFLVPVAAVAAGRGGVAALVRLWVSTLLMNIAGGCVGMAIVVSGLPSVRAGAVEIARKYPEQGIGWTSLATALLGGATVTLMTWMERSTDSTGGKITAAVVASFLLAAGPLNHAIVVALELFAGLLVGAPYGGLDWLTMVAWVALGNLIGGVGLVTLLRLVQVGGQEIERAGREA